MRSLPRRSSFQAASSLLAAGLLASLAVACGGATEGGAGGPAGESGGETAESELRTSRLIDKWVSETDEFASDLGLMEGGTFVGELNRIMIGAPSCGGAPRCTQITAGRWRIKGGDTLVLDVPKIAEVTEAAVTLEIPMALRGDTLTLGAASEKQTFTRFVSPCKNHACPTGERCVVGSRGAPVCSRVVPH